MQARNVRWHVSTYAQDALARKHVSTQGTWASKYVSTQGPRARGRVSTQGTLARWIRISNTEENRRVFEKKIVSKFRVYKLV